MTRKPARRGKAKRPRDHAAPSHPKGADVAILAGVSQSAVSRVLRPGGSASSAVRAKVLEAAATLGYRRNYLASAMKTRQTSMIAVILSGTMTIYYPEVLRELCAAIAATGCRAMVYLVDDSAGELSAVDAIVSYRIDAAIALVSLTSDHVALLERHDIRLVFYNREGTGYGRDVVTCDHQESGNAAARHLLELGHRRCAVIAGPSWSSVSSERIAGIAAARDENGNALTILAQVNGDYTYASGRVAMSSLASSNQDFTAVIACNDAMAAAAVDVARTEWGRRIGHDLSIIGFDGTEFGQWQGYQLTTLVQPVARLCASAVEMLTADAGASDGERRVFQAVLRPGTTTGPFVRSSREA